ncbi:N-acetyltransferase [Ruegeria sp. EL01]|jgi:ribosomal-protein-alanine N-acetyltransferase|uniref:GNAT family N-acetyltransferase n=1 Tax=Ruegeria sp. EL01 TaxID=2107578 RepID=UPI000EA818BE|nr:N-acetyltransferase [Ruegeria sp. EL01]
MTPQDMASIHAAAFTQSRPWSADEFTDLLKNPFTHALGTPDSFAVFQVIAGEAELLTIATHPDYQRKGKGLKCMKSWHAKAVEIGATRAFLDVASDNLAAISLYDCCGYRPCGRRDGYYTAKNGAKRDAITMECSLR